MTDEQQVKGPTPTEVCNDYRIDGHGCEKLPPRGLEFLKVQRECCSGLAFLDFLFSGAWPGTRVWDEMVMAAFQLTWVRG